MPDPPILQGDALQRDRVITVNISNSGMALWNFLLLFDCGEASFDKKDAEQKNDQEESLCHTK